MAVGLFINPQSAGEIEDSIRRAGARILTADDLKRIGAGLGAAEGTNDLEAKAGAAPRASAPVAAAVFDWQAENAYSLALQAFIYGFPYVYNAQTRYKWTNISQDPKHVPYAPVNTFWHATEVIDATYRDGGCPNNDTLYSIAWVELERGADDPHRSRDLAGTLLDVSARGVYLGQLRLCRPARRIHRQATMRSSAPTGAAISPRA